MKSAVKFSLIFLIQKTFKILTALFAALTILRTAFFAAAAITAAAQAVFSRFGLKHKFT